MAKKYNGTTLENGLYYTDHEIYTSYRDAPDKLEQIKKLMDLNLCEIEDIIQALVRGGLTKLENNSYFTNEELLSLYTSSYDKRKFMSEMSQIHKCSVTDIKDILLKAGLSFRVLPRESKKSKALNNTDTTESKIKVTNTATNISKKSTVQKVDNNTDNNISDTTNTLFLNYFKNAANVYQEQLLIKKTHLEEEISNTELTLKNLKLELEDCENQLNISKMVLIEK